MLHYVYSDDLNRIPDLAHQMFRDRAAQFRDRLKWDVSVDADGCERDGYDDQNPLYVIATDKAGRHAGSMRLLPTTGNTMLNDHFVHLLPNGQIHSPFIWECTRFCLSPHADTKVASALMMAGGEVLQHFDVRNFVGVFDRTMQAVYRKIGASPDVIGTDGRVSAGLWTFTSESQICLSKKSGISVQMSRQWFERSFDNSLSQQVA